MEQWPDIRGAEIICVDVETKDPDLKEKGCGATRDGYIAGVAVGWRFPNNPEVYTAYYPIRHEGGGNLDRKQVWAYLRDMLTTNVPKTGANLQYDLNYLWSEGIQVQGPFYDIQVAEPLLDEERGSYSLENIAQTRLGVGKDEDAMAEYIRSNFGAKAGKEKEFIWKCPAHIVDPYAREDVRLPILILDQQLKELEQEEMLDLWQMESDLLPILSRMHLAGVRVDAAYAEQLSYEWGNEIITLEQQTEGINSRSSKQIASYLDSIGFVYPRTPKGNPSITGKWMETVADEVPLFQPMMRLKKLKHFKSTFVDGYINDSVVAGRVHAQFNQLKGDEYGTVTGRLSGSKPNLQNIPNPEKDPYFSSRCRGMYLPEVGQEWLRYDFSQIEYRLLVHFASLLPGGVADSALAAYIENPNMDFHATCAEITGLDKRYGAKLGRKYAKNINFGLCLAEGSLILTDKGLVPIEHVTIDHKVWDGEAWVAHAGVVFNGYKEVIEYDGVIATPDHIVFTTDGQQVPIWQLASDVAGPRIAVSGDAANPVTVSFAVKDARQGNESFGALQILQENGVGACRQLAEEQGLILSLCTKSSAGRQVLQGIMGEHQASLQLSNQPSVSGLWRQGDQTLVYARSVCGVLSEELQLRGNYQEQVANRQAGEQWSLRARQHQIRNTTSQPVKPSPKTRMAKVYDIVDAGPNNRFTCNNKLVHNCYGMGTDKLARSLGVPLSESKEIFKVYHAKAPFAKAFMEAASQRASNRGYVRTIGRRKRRFNNWESSKFIRKEDKVDGEIYMLKDKAAAIEKWGAVKRAHTHAAANAVLQGSSADITKRAMVEGYKRGVYDVIGFPLVTVHDELGFSIETGNPRHEEAAKEMKDIMENAYKLAVPVLVSDGRGANWGLAG